jgi:hypothetical protein
VQLELPFHNNFADDYAIIAFADDHEQAGFQPVRIGPNAPGQLDLMLLPKNGSFHFAGARWSDLQEKKPLVAQIFAASVTGAPDDAYAGLMESHPDRLACLLNITTALEQISLPQKSPLDYFKNFDLAALAPDRIFGYGDAQLLAQVRLAAQQGDSILSRPSMWPCTVIPNGLTGTIGNPRVVYVLRWIAGRHAGIPEFDPLYTVE